MRSRILVTILGLLLVVPAPTCLGKMAQGKKKKHPPATQEQKLADRIAKIRTHLSEARDGDPAVTALTGQGRNYAGKAEQQLAGGQLFAADRLAGAADALARVADHLAHARDESRPQPPRLDELARRLEKTYFRVQQADYFLAQSKDAKAKVLVRYARRFYQQARQSYDRKEARQADEFAKAADEVVKALEHLAQAATPVPVPPLLR